jgi:xanthine dehydrogenase FAD-binding subunit
MAASAWWGNLMGDVYRPLTLVDALSIRARLGAVVFAGGTDLMVKRRAGAGVLPDFPGPVLFLDRIAELEGISGHDGEFEIRSMTRLSQIARSARIPEVLQGVVLDMGGPALRNMATLGGNVCNASPAGDTLPPLYALEAEVVLASLSGSRVVERRLPIGSFIKGPGVTALAPNEILTSVKAASPKQATLHWRKVGTRKANALTKVSIAALVTREGERVCRARIALGAVAPTVVRLLEVERMLEGSVDRERRSRTFLDAARAACEAAIHPIDDQRSSAEYRKQVATNLLVDFITKRV